MMHDARFYFANLSSDVHRCISALQHGNRARFVQSRDRAYRTLRFLRGADRPEVYEEGQLMLRGLEYARQQGELDQYEQHLTKLMQQFSIL